MTSDRQFTANALNAQRSTGPRSDAGKARSAQNATKHGLCSALEREADQHTTFDTRRAAWSASIKPQSDEADYALDRAVVASIRIEQCEGALDALGVAQSTRARLTWDDDRTIEAATLLGQIARDPVLVAAQLASTRHGADLLIQTWNRLGEALVANGDWSDDERSVALDLLGVPADLRDGKTRLDPTPGRPIADWLRAVAVEQIDRLNRKKDESLNQIDALDRHHAEVSALIVLSKPAALIMRYEREAWRRLRESLKIARAPMTESEAPRFVQADAPLARPETPPAPAREPEVPEITPAMRARVEELTSGRTRPETPEARAAMLAEMETLARTFAARRVALGLPTIEEEDDMPIEIAAATPRHLNRHQRRALAATGR